MDRWENCRNLLLIRLDNMGDVIMNNAAFEACREQIPKCKLTLLTSSMAAPIVPYLQTIDDCIIFDVPWMKSNGADPNMDYLALIERIKSFHFDGCILFSVYSQNIFPAALLAYLAGIPLRGGYARENPYLLLTHWIPDREPLCLIHHQIKRDLLLLQHLGLQVDTTRLPRIQIPRTTADAAKLLKKIGVQQPFIIINFDVSDSKRQFPAAQANLLIKTCLAAGYTLVFTGVKRNEYLESCMSGIGNERFFNVVENTSIHELILLIAQSEAIISVNTGLAHIACAMRRPVCVLYANSNPQHGPWTQNSLQLSYEIQEEYKSKNEIIRYVDRTCQPSIASAPMSLGAIVQQSLNWLTAVTTASIRSNSQKL
jgi:ADP-heptose:LPS heptosyltransferase